MKTKIKIAIADDHTIFRKGFVSLLEQLGYDTILFDVGNAKEIFENLKTKTPDLLFLDIQMPDTEGTETLEKIKKLYSETKVIILSSFYEDDLIIEFIKKGSSSFLSKSCDPDILVKTIETVYETGFYYDEKIVSLIPKILHADPSDNSYKEANRLTKREIEIIQLMCKGMKSQEIAEILNIDIRTVESHRSNIWKKTNCENVISLKEFALKRHLL